MRQTWTRAATAAAVLVGAMGLGTVADDKPAVGEKGKEITWAKSFGKAVSEAKTGDKLIMVDFYTDWCGWCKKLDKDTYADPGVARLADQRLVALKLDAEDKSEGEELAKKYNVHAYPTILFLDPAKAESKDGGVVGKIGGYMPPEPFAKQVNRIADAFRDLPKLEAKLMASPDDPEANARLAAIYCMRGRAKEAVGLLEKAEKGDPDNKTGALGVAYNAVGDYYQEDQKFNRAIALFRKAAEVSKDSTDVAYARESIAVCYFALNQPEKAVPELEAVSAMPGLPKSEKEQVDAMLKQAREAAKSKKKPANDDK